jgi:hypothetical protein
MVVHLLSWRRDPVDEVDRSREVAELELTLDLVAFAPPTREVVEASFYLVITQK